eukprot:4620758-Amphidinium_carterae.1
MTVEVRKEDFQRVLHPSLLLQQMTFFSELERKYAGIVTEISAVVSVIKVLRLCTKTTPPGKGIGKPIHGMSCDI